MTSVSSAAAAASAASAASTTSSTSSSNSSGIAGNLSTFLQILTTQLTHQDPTSATDTNQFTQELVQFAQVEQQLNTNSNLGELVNLQKSSNGLTSTLNYIGKYAEVPTAGKQIALQDGSTEIGYNLTSAAQSVSISVQNSSGTTVANLTGSTTPGMNYVTWDGTNADGSQSADGSYTFTLKATNSDGTAQTVSNIYTIGKVTGVTTNTDGTFNLSIGNDLSVDSSSVAAVFDASNLPTATKTGT